MKMLVIGSHERHNANKINKYTTLIMISRISTYI